MECPVCKGSCITDAPDLFLSVPAVFEPCPLCRAKPLDKQCPPPERPSLPPCSCGRRFIDEVFLDIYGIFQDEGIFSGTEPLCAAGSPLLHPGYPMKQPPFLGERSLVLLSGVVTRDAAARVYTEIKEVKGVVRTGPFVPGPGPGGRPRTYRLLSGCDVRADLFFSRAGPVAVYKQQSRLHIEFPRARHEKGERLDRLIASGHHHCVADLCAGAGTLGLIAARAGIRHVILNDAWYPAAFWSAVNVAVNQVFFATDAMRVLYSYKDLETRNTLQKPLCIGEASGSQEVEVWLGDCTALALEGHVPGGCLGILDLFEKSDLNRIKVFEGEWKRLTGGEVFIP